MANLHSIRFAFFDKVVVVLLALGRLLAAGGEKARGADISAVWGIGSVGNWSDPTKWSSDPNFPNNGNGGFTYDASISSGTVALDQDIAIQNLALSGSGTITGSFNLTLNDTNSTWSGGTMSGAGQTTIASGATLNLTGGSIARPLVNNGTTVFFGSGTSISSTFQNNGIFLADTNAGPAFTGSAGAVFNNAGSFTKSSNGTATFNSGTTFNNTGTVDVQAGTLRLEGGGTHTGDFTGSAGATLRLQGSHTLAAGADITGALDLLFNTGTITENGSIGITGAFTIQGNSSTLPTFNGPVSVGSLNMSSGTATFNNTLTTPGGTLSGGTLTGSADWNVTGTLNWSGGTMSGAGQTTIASGATANLGTITLNRTLINSGTLTVANIKVVSLNNGSGLFNTATGTIEFQGSNTVQTSSGVIGGLINDGLIRKTGASGSITDIRTDFVNDGTVHVEGVSVFSMHRNGEHDGTFDIDVDAAVQLEDSVHRFRNDAEIIGDGELLITHQSTAIIEGNLDVGRIKIDNASTLDMQVDGTVGTLRFLDGQITGPGDLHITSSIVFEGDVDLDSDVEVDPSTSVAIPSNGSLVLGLPANIKSPAGQSISSLENDGEITKTSGGSSRIEIKVNNHGTMTIGGGSGLELPEDFAQDGGELKVNGDVIFGGQANVSGGKVSGSGKIHAPSCAAGQVCIDVNGTLIAGNSPGKLEVLGSLEGVFELLSRGR